MNRDGAIVVIAIAALVLVAYQSGYIPFGEENTSDSVESEPVNDGDTLPSSLDEIHPLASTCLDHGGLTRHDHMNLYIRTMVNLQPYLKIRALTLTHAINKVPTCTLFTPIQTMEGSTLRCKQMKMLNWVFSLTFGDNTSIQQNF